MSLSRYPKYKKTGIDWLGEVPAHWQCVRLGAIFREVSEPGNDELPILSVSIHDGVSDKELDEGESDRKVTRSDDRSKYKAVAPGDLTYNMMRAWQGGFGTVSVHGMVSPAYVVARPKAKFATSIVEMLLRTPNAVSEMKRYSRGVTDFRLRLYWDDFKTIQIALPPVEEQKAISAFLDRETPRIDALIAEQEKLIALLAEKRQATISHAVTKGLNHNAPQKDSGVAWLGNVPAHWEVRRLGALTSKIGSGKTPSGGADAYVNEGVTFLRSQNVYDEGLMLEDVVSISETIDEEMAGTRVEGGDILLNITGASLGRTCLVPENFTRANVNQHVCIVRLDKPGHREFVSLALKASSTKAQIDAMQNGAAREGLNFEQIRALVLALPSIEEQGAIVKFVRAELEGLDALAKAATCANRLLVERRSALIAAAVTGQIDVRGVVTAPAANREE